MLLAFEHLIGGRGCADTDRLSSNTTFQTKTKNGWQSVRIAGTREYWPSSNMVLTVPTVMPLLTAAAWAGWNLAGPSLLEAFV